ncbi:MAG: hypothetical protein SP1CHLAM54_03060 [Chlamydiia bacterium]|nr:hypothetical protein [Chlamydiia bacterium]MCH9615222.1 hypothetical protein [Chlamydiia bacterium]MCH9628456.1 hypothetical protein [Chlamydiia bacterium]
MFAVSSGHTDRLRSTQPPRASDEDLTKFRSPDVLKTAIAAIENETDSVRAFQILDTKHDNLGKRTWDEIQQGLASDEPYVQEGMHYRKKKIPGGGTRNKLLSEVDPKEQIMSRLRMHLREAEKASPSESARPTPARRATELFLRGADQSAARSASLTRRPLQHRVRPQRESHTDRRPPTLGLRPVSPPPARTEPRRLPRNLLQRKVTPLFESRRPASPAADSTSSDQSNLFTAPPTFTRGRRATESTGPRRAVSTARPRRAAPRSGNPALEVLQSFKAATSERGFDDQALAAWVRNVNESVLGFRDRFEMESTTAPDRFSLQGFIDAEIMAAQSAHRVSDKPKYDWGRGLKPAFYGPPPPPSIRDIVRPQAPSELGIGLPNPGTNNCFLWSMMQVLLNNPGLRDQMLPHLPPVVRDFAVEYLRHQDAGVALSSDVARAFGLAIRAELNIRDQHGHIGFLRHEDATEVLSSFAHVFSEAAHIGSPVVGTVRRTSYKMVAIDEIISDQPPPIQAAINECRDEYRAGRTPSAASFTIARTILRDYGSDEHIVAALTQGQGLQFSSTATERGLTTSQLKIPDGVDEADLREMYASQVTNVVRNSEDRTIPAAPVMRTYVDTNKFEGDPPAQLMFTLTRMPNRVVKNQTPVTCPDEMVIQGRAYRLKSFVAHRGGQISGGHYISANKNADGTWTYFNDGTVQVIDDTEAKRELPQAAMVYYEAADVPVPPAPLPGDQMWWQDPAIVPVVPEKPPELVAQEAAAAEREAKLSAAGGSKSRSLSRSKTRLGRASSPLAKPSSGTTKPRRRFIWG